MTDYEKYQLEWMVEHGYSLEVLMEHLDDVSFEYETNVEGVGGAGEIFEIWKNQYGFKGGEIWACEDEWKNNEKKENTKLSALDIYKKLGTNDRYLVGCKLQCYVSISSFVENPTDEEYEVITDKCYEVYLKMENIDLVRLCDGVAERYANGQFSLEELKTMDKWKIMEFYQWY